MENSNSSSYYEQEVDIKKIISENKRRLMNTIKFHTAEEDLKIKQIKNKHTFNYEGFNLDLTYITERIIAMGFPYEEHVENLNKLFTQRHNNKVKVYNLCTERFYEDNIFNCQARYPFDDHEVPNFDILFKFCKDVDDWLSRDKENIAVVHCKAGIGRTGTVISSYLLYKNFVNDPEHAMTFFREMRTVDGIAMKNPSQLRYVRYFFYGLKMNLAPPIQSNQIVFTRFQARNFGEDIEREFINDRIKLELHIHVNKEDKYKINLKDENSTDFFGISTDDIEEPLLLSGDVKFCVVMKHLSEDTEECICYVYINTLFAIQHLPDSLVFKKDKVDKAFRDTKNIRFRKDFEIEVIFEAL